MNSAPPSLFLLIYFFQFKYKKLISMFLDPVFSILIFLDSILIFKCHFSNQKHV